MSMKNSIVLEPWVRVFDFAGRSRRREYLIFYAEFFGAIWLITYIFGGGHIDSSSFDRLPILVQLSAGTLVLLAILPGLSLQVRRLHDQNRTGWWMLLNAIPILGHFLVVLLMLYRGDPGDNRFGHNPRPGK